MREIHELWPSSKALSVPELREWAFAFQTFDLPVVLRALGRAKRESERAARPSIRSVKNLCMAEIREKDSGGKEGPCPWCRGRWPVRVTLFVVDWHDLQISGVPEKHAKQVGVLNRYVVIPDVGRTYKLKSTPVITYCGRCRPKLGFMAFPEFHREYETYYEFADHQSQGIGQRLLMDTAMPEDDRRPAWEWRQAWERGEFTLSEEESDFLKNRPQRLSELVKSPDEESVSKKICGPQKPAGAQERGDRASGRTPNDSRTDQDGFWRG